MFVNFFAKCETLSQSEKQIIQNSKKAAKKDINNSSAQRFKAFTFKLWHVDYKD